MSAKKRTDLINKLYRLAKKEYRFGPPPSSRSVLEHMLYGCCLEDSTYDAADEAFAKLQENYFDWNEVRVTTESELAELMKGLGDPAMSAFRLKKTLHGVFESYYQFDLDFLKKENLNKAVTQFKTYKGVSPFVISYVVQNGLGGHSIPIDRSLILLCYTVGIISRQEAEENRIPGLERTISKAKGIEFSGLVHQLAVAFASSPFNTKLREKLLKVNPEAKERFPKRGGRKKKETVEEESPKAKSSVKKGTKKGRAKGTTQGAATKEAAASKKGGTKKSPARKKKGTTAQPASTTKKKKPAAKKASKKTTKKPAVKKATKKKLPQKSSTAKSAASKRLARKKPR